MTTRPDRPPDYVEPEGNEFWFRECLYSYVVYYNSQDIDTHYGKIVVSSASGLLFPASDVFTPWGYHIQNAYKDWLAEHELLKSVPDTKEG